MVGQRQSLCKSGNIVSLILPLSAGDHHDSSSLYLPYIDEKEKRRVMADCSCRERTGKKRVERFVIAEK
ncbi:unnamed protein product [Linum trigynum]|uniref:Uncharacterized protein n=1 Tax=Linum trigynum TaxID=586398 RepID=A0AAV2GIB4_9ROSI